MVSSSEVSEEKLLRVPTPGTISCEECPKETSQDFERVPEQDIYSAERLTDSDAQKEEVSDDTFCSVHATKEVCIAESSPGLSEQPREFSTPYHELEAAIDQKRVLADAHATLMRKFEERSRELDTAIREKREMGEVYAALSQECDSQRNQNKALHRDNESLRAMLERRTSELYGVEKFFTTADKFSGSEVVSALRKLNQGVQQSSTFMAEWTVRNLKFEAPRVHQTSTRVDEQTRVSGLLGVRFMRALKTRKQVDDPILVEIAFQAYLMYELYAVASQRSTEESHNALIDGIYRRMREAEGQAISGNWRALTHRYAASARTKGPDFMCMMKMAIVSGLSDVLLAAGCTNSPHDIKSALGSKFADKIHDFVSLARDINMVIGAGVISEDLQILSMRPEIPFDRKVMQDWEDNGKGQGSTSEIEGPQETVLCTIELGLMKRMRATAAEKRNGVLDSIMIKPRVALMSILDTI